MGESKSDTALRLYRWLLALYPRDIRERRGAELWQTGRDMAEAARTGDGAGALLAGALRRYTAGRAG